MFGLPVVPTYDEFVGLYLNLRRARTQKSEWVRVGMRNAETTEPLGHEWFECIAEDLFDTQAMVDEDWNQCQEAKIMRKRLF